MYKHTNKLPLFVRTRGKLRMLGSEFGSQEVGWVCIGKQTFNIVPHIHTHTHSHTHTYLRKTVNFRTKKEMRKNRKSSKEKRNRCEGWKWLEDVGVSNGKRTIAHCVNSVTTSDCYNGMYPYLIMPLQCTNNELSVRRGSILCNVFSACIQWGSLFMDEF